MAAKVTYRVKAKKARTAKERAATYAPRARAHLERRCDLIRAQSCR